MSRSRKKHPFRGITTATSEKNDKRLAHRAYRRALRRLKLSDPDNLIVPLRREMSNLWCFDKDGKWRFDPAEHPEWMRK